MSWWIAGIIAFILAYKYIVKWVPLLESTSIYILFFKIIPNWIINLVPPGIRTSGYLHHNANTPESYDFYSISSLKHLTLKYQKKMIFPNVDLSS